MSKRFLRWAETWIEENIPPGANPDIESHEARAKRMMEQMYAEAAAANFPDFETKEERDRQHRFRHQCLSPQDATGGGE